MRWMQLVLIFCIILGVTLLLGLVHRVHSSTYYKYYSLRAGMSESQVRETCAPHAPGDNGGEMVDVYVTDEGWIVTLWEQDPQGGRRTLVWKDFIRCNATPGWVRSLVDTGFIP